MRRCTLLAAQTTTLGAGLLSVLAACNPGVQAPQEQGPQQLASTNLSFATWWVPPLAFGTATEKALREFEAKNTNIKIQVEALADNAGVNLEKVQTLVAAGTPPDLSLIRPPHVGYFATRGAFLAVDDRLQKDRRVARGDFFPVALERLTWQGKTWGLPAEVHFVLNVYNEELFASAGQPLPDAAWNWDRWLEAAKRLTAAGVNSSTRTFGAELPQWEALVWSWGGEILNKLETECILNKPPAPEALQWRADALLRHGVAPTAADYGGQNARTFFASGRLGMLPIGNWALQDIARDAKLRWGAAPLPQGRAGAVTFAAGANYAIFQGSKLQDAAWAVLSDLALGEGLKTLLAGSSLFPAVRSVAKPELLPSYTPDWLKATLSAAERARHPHFSHPRHVEINQVLGEQLAAVWKGEKQAQVAADEATRLVNPLLK